MNDPVNPKVSLFFASAALVAAFILPACTTVVEKPSPQPTSNTSTTSTRTDTTALGYPVGTTTRTNTTRNY
jgi:outer membrane biogenesis lipoprotein LolB